MSTITKDPLQAALYERDRKPLVFPISSGSYFSRESTINHYFAHHFRISLRNRLIAFATCFLLGVLTFVYAMTKFFSIILDPKSFTFPYAFSNLMFFLMIGFLKGFGSYFEDLFSKEKRIFSASFLASTFFCLFVINKKYKFFMSLFILIIQVISCLCFFFNFLPGGPNGLRGLVKMLLRR